MRKRSIIKNIETFVKQRLRGEGTGHDWWHITRVRANARQICQSEKADRFMVDLALLLHDVGDRKVIHKDADDYTIAERAMQKEKVLNSIIERVLFIIQNMSFSKSLDKKRKDAPIEFYVVQDADRLDAMGAIGIARAFAFGGSRARPLYDPTRTAQRIRSMTMYHTMQSSTLHHFEEKLFLLKDLMNTKTAKNIARNRHVFMKKYMAQFLNEWNGAR